MFCSSRWTLAQAGEDVKPKSGGEGRGKLCIPHSTGNYTVQNPWDQGYENKRRLRQIDLGHDGPVIPSPQGEGRYIGRPRKKNDE